MNNKNSHTLFDLMHPSGGNELWQDIVGYEDGGFVGYQYGSGASAEQILQDQGLTATPEQLALFADMDTTQIQDLATGLQEGLLAGGQQQSQQIAGAGFAGGGAGEQALSQQRKRSEQALSTGVERAKTAFESQTLGTAADIVAGGGEFGSIGYTGVNVSGSQLGSGYPTYMGKDVGERAFSGGYNWEWDGTTWNQIAMGGSGGCFLAGTSIDVGDSSFPIEELKIGDVVKTYDLERNKYKKSEITETYKHNVDGYLIINGFIKTTIYHPFYSNGEWVKAGDLKIGDKMLHVDGVEHKIESIEKVNGKIDVYNIEVDGTHNYFAEGYLVHNK